MTQSNARGKARPSSHTSDGSEAEDIITGRLPPIWAFSVLLVVILAGALFGYDQGVISGALLGIEKEFSLSAFVLEIVTSWVTLGALFGSLAGGYVADHYGRKPALLVAALLFVVGAAIEAFAPSVPSSSSGGLQSASASASPRLRRRSMPRNWRRPQQRGRFISSYQLAITIGIFLAYIVDEALSGPNGWRLMLGVSAIPGVLLLLAVLPAAESPRWFLKMGRLEDARRVLHEAPSQRRSRSGREAQDCRRRRFKSRKPRPRWSEIFAPRWRGALEVGLGLAVLQQLTGINAIIYYSDRIFAAAGFASPAAQAHATTWAIGGVNVLATFIAIATIDHLGRRKLLLAGLIGMGLSLTAVGFRIPATSEREPRRARRRAAS